MTEKLKTSRFDAADYIRSADGEIVYLKALFEDEEFDAEIFLSAIGDILRARSMTRIAEATGIERDNLLDALQSDSNSRLQTIQKVLDALDLKLDAKALFPRRAAAE